MPVREVELERLVDAITPGTTLVACSLVQKQTGRTAPIRAIVARAAEVSARVLLEVSQGAPLVPLGDLVDRIDYPRIRASFRGTGIRLSPHVYNDAADIARAIEALATVVRPAQPSRAGAS